jgi:hypothetical protein
VELEKWEWSGVERMAIINNVFTEVWWITVLIYTVYIK